MKRTFKGAIASVLLTGAVFAGNMTGLDTQTRSVHFLVDSKGMALYTFDKDTLNQSNCTGGCLEKWPRLMSHASTQIAYRKHPLYTFFKDTKPEETKGDRVKSVWHPVYPAKGFKKSSMVKLSKKTKKQRYLADSKSMALYIFDKDSKDQSNCTKGCLQKWPAFYTDLQTLRKGFNKKDFGTIKRSDGTMQTTYKGMPLYYFFKDSKPKQTNGDWAKGVWHLVDLGA